MKEFHMVAFLFVVLGALNWGLVALFDFNLVTTVFGSAPALERLVYLLVGGAALYELATHMKSCRYCKK